MLNWILAANGPPITAGYKVPWCSLMTNSNGYLFHDRKEAGKWDCWDMSGVLSWFELQIIWAPESSFCMFLLGQSGLKLYVEMIIMWGKRVQIGYILSTHSLIHKHVSYTPVVGCKFEVLIVSFYTSSYFYSTTYWHRHVYWNRGRFLFILGEVHPHYAQTPFCFVSEFHY